MQTLAQKTCTACTGDESPLAPAEIEKYLIQTPGWQNSKNTAICRQLITKNFKDALALINQIGQIAETEGHHPDICLYDYKKVSITLSTHAISGLSENDFIVAAKINQLLDSRV